MEERCQPRTEFGRNCHLHGREREAPKKQEEQSKRREENQERTVFSPFPIEGGSWKETELGPAEAKKEGEERRNSLNLAIELPDRKTVRHNDFAIQFGKHLKD